VGKPSISFRNFVVPILDESGTKDSRTAIHAEPPPQIKKHHSTLVALGLDTFLAYHLNATIRKCPLAIRFFPSKPDLQLLM